MILKRNIRNIATILPYKESYTFHNASAVSLWVSEFFKESKFRNNNYIYGNTNPGKYLTKFHLLDAVSITSLVCIFNLLHNDDSSFIRLIFTNRWVFSIILLNSATLIELAS